MHLPSSLSAHASTLVLATMLAGSLGLGCPGPEPQVMEGAGGEDAATGTGPSSTTGLPASSSGSSAGSTKVSSGVGGKGGDGGEGGAGGKGGDGGDGGENHVGTTTGAGGCDDVENNPLHCGACGFACSTEGVEEGFEPKCILGECVPRCAPFRYDLTQPDPLEDAPDDGCETTARRVFVTADRFPANLGDVLSYDDECAQLSQELEPPGVGWTAWISDGQSSAEERLLPTDVPYVLLDNQVIAWSWEELVNDGPIVPIGLTDDFTDLLETAGDPEDRLVWTGTLDSGDSSDTDCLGWTTNSAEEEATFGLVMTELDLIKYGPAAWTDLGAGPCNSLARLYCFEHP